MKRTAIEDVMRGMEFRIATEPETPAVTQKINGHAVKVTRRQLLDKSWGEWSIDSVTIGGADNIIAAILK